MITVKSISTFFIAGACATAMSTVAFAQAPPAPIGTSTVYRETTPKINDLVHTKLDVRFDYKKRYMYGKEWVTLKPHFYPTDSLRLDAKGMDIKSISVVKQVKIFRLNISMRIAFS
jgi:aminopeptidase N